jgi:tetratricopeptide (TPR) repeat protein
MKNINTLAISLACISLAGCAASVPAIQTTETPARAMPTLVLEESTPEIEYGSFTEDQLYEAIVSELSAQRGQVAEAGDSYFDLAMSTRDITIIQRAIQFASVNSDINALLQLGMLWAQLEPTNPQPQLLLSIQFLESGAFEQAISHMSRVLELGGDMDFAVLSSRTGRLNPQLRSVLIENLRRLKGEFNNQTSIHLTLVQLLAQNGDFEEALTEVEQLKDNTDLTPNIVMLQSQILQNMERPAQSMRVMRSGLAGESAEAVATTTTLSSLARVRAARERKRARAARVREHA